MEHLTSNKKMHVVIYFNVKKAFVYESDFYANNQPYDGSVTVLWEENGHYYKYWRKGIYDTKVETLQELLDVDYAQEMKKFRLLPIEREGYDIIKRQQDFKKKVCFSLDNIHISKSSVYMKPVDDLLRPVHEKREKMTQEKKEYAWECGRIAKSHGWDFQNVLAFHKDIEALQRFYVSLIAAAHFFQTLDDDKKRELAHAICECGRARKSAALDELGVMYRPADPNRICIEGLEQVLRDSWRRKSRFKVVTTETIL